MHDRAVTIVDAARRVAERLTARMSRQARLVPRLRSSIRQCARLLHGHLKELRSVTLDQCAKWCATGAGNSRLPTAFRRQLRRANLRLRASEPVVRARQRDGADNALTTPPNTEQILVPCLWLVEFYTPSSLGSLMRRLRRWSARSSQLNADDHLIQWLAASRSGHGNGYEFGHRGHGTNGRPDRPTLPPEFSHVTLSFDSISSVVVLSARFALTVHHQGCLAASLRTQYEAHTEVLRNGTYRVIDVFTAKRKACDNAIDGLRRSAQRWMRANLPGLLASRSPETALPSMVLVMMADTEPFVDNASFLRPLGLEPGDEFDRHWTSKEVPGLSLRASRGRHEDRLWLAMRHPDLRVADCQFLDAQVSGMALEILSTRWALSSLLRELESSVTSIRDAVVSQRGSRGSPAFRILARKMPSVGLDAQTVASDIVVATKSARVYNFGSDDDFCLAGGASSTTFTAVIRRRQRRQAKRLERSTESLRDVLSTLADMTMASSGLSLQRWSIAIAIVSLIIAVIAAVAAFLGMPHLPSWLPGRW